MIHFNTLRWQIETQLALFLMFGLRSTAFAYNIQGYCSCVQGGTAANVCKNQHLADAPLLNPDCGVHLLQPLDDTTKYLQPANGSPFQTLKLYFQISWPWIVGCAAGIAVLQAVYGGVQIMLSGSDTGMRSAGKERLMWALAGLLLIGLSGLVLQIINPIYYYQ